MMEDRRLIAACKRQDRGAQKEIYERYSPAMMAVCLRYCGDEETARDLLHDGFITVFTKIDSYSYRGSFEGWMRRIFVNLALANFRERKRERLVLDEYAKERETGGEDISLPLHLVPQQKVFQMIQELPDGYRTVFNLYVLENLSHKEIAKRLDILETSSRSQLFRAKRMLQAKIIAFLKTVKVTESNIAVGDG